jgi:transposase-like protein
MYNGGGKESIMEKKTAMLNPDQIILGKMDVGRRPESIFPRTPSDPSRNIEGNPNPEVLERPVRRMYTAEYKLKILKEAESLPPGELGVLLRREGLYSSNLTTWRRQKEEGTLEALSPRKRGPKAPKPNPLTRKLAELTKENEKLKKKLKQAEMIIEFQKKISEILQIPIENEERQN